MNYFFTLMLIFVSYATHAQLGFLKVYDDAISSEYEDVLIDNDTIVLYGISRDSSGVQGIKFYKYDSLGTLLTEHIFVQWFGQI